jgi:hypothetical protein
VAHFGQKAASAETSLFSIELYFQSCYMPGNVRVQWLVLFGILKQSGERVCVFCTMSTTVIISSEIYFCGQMPFNTAQMTKKCRFETVIYSTLSHTLYWFSLVLYRAEACRYLPWWVFWRLVASLYHSSCRYPKSGYPLMEYEGIALMRRPLAARRTVLDPAGWAGQRTPRGRKDTTPQ